MYDRERIASIIGDIERYLSDLQELNITEVSDLDDRRSFYAASMVLFSILNRTIDLGEELVAAKNPGMPSTYRGIFELLARDKIVTASLGAELSRLVFYRNLLSHEYHRVREADVLDVSGRMNTVREFVNKAKELLQST